jgi:protein-disulfide isomerase
MAIIRKCFAPVLLALLAVVAAAADGASRESASSCVGTDPDAPIVMEVFSDHQCPACRRFYLEVARPVLADYAMKGKVCVIYHDFPLRSHQYARQAARYTQAAGRLGQQEWIQVTDALYVYQSQWSANGRLESVVTQALSKEKMTQVKKWLEDPQLDTEIDSEIALGRRLGVRATPTVFIKANGKTEKIPAGVQYPILRRYLDSLLARAQ